MPALTRGPLPARVYWVRRLLVLGIALLLVVGVARLLGGGSDGSDGSDGPTAARQVAADPSPDATDATATPGISGGPGATGTAGTRKGQQKPTEPPLAMPDGPCADEDVAVTPVVDGAVAGRDVRVRLQLRTLKSEACTWKVSPRSLAVTITSGKDDIWSSRDCPRAIATREVVVRRAETTTIDLTWKEARRSDDTCSNRTEWAMPGWYHVTAAALAGEPSDAQFELGTPAAATITKTARPKKPRPGGRPIAKPSGAVEPD